MKTGNKIIRGAEEALAHAKDENDGSRVTEVYELPRLEDGSVDFEILGELHENGLLDELIDDVFKAIDANARAEERERCAKIAELPSVLSGGPNGDRRAEIIAACIRNLGDE